MLKHLLRRISPEGVDGRLSTLIFHRVLPEPDPLFPDETDTVRFDGICRWIKAWFNVLPLDEAILRLGRRELPERAMTITFDDGYADNHGLALPILTKYGLPATFFIATGFLDGGRMWNDTVIESIRRCSGPMLDLTNLGIETLGVFDLATPLQRRQSIDIVLRAVKYLPAEERSTVAQRIAVLAGVLLPNDLMMTSEHIRGLRHAGMQVGAHTVSHPILAGLCDASARAEMADSKQHLERILDESVTTFAYPNGRPGVDFTDRSVQIAREIGFMAAVSTAKGVADASTNPFRIPRYTPWDRSKMRFGARLATNLWTASAGQSQ